MPATPPGSEATQADRLRRRFELLLDAGVAIFSERSLNGVLQRVVDSAREVVGTRYAAVGVMEQGGPHLKEFVTSGLTHAERAHIGALPTGGGLLGAVIHDANPIRIADIQRDPRRCGFPPGHPPMTSFLGVPVVAAGRVFGNLYLTDKVGGGAFDAEDEAIAVFLAAKAAVAVENAQLHERSQQLLAQVEAMHRQRDLFFAMMNHELRNALTGVFGWAERLVRGKGGEGHAAHAAREVYDGAERTITLLNNFLDLTRLDAGKMRPVMRDVDVRAAVAHAITAVIPSAEAKRVAFEERYDNGANLRTDPLRLEQILVNLLTNAIRHSPEEATITVHVGGDAGTITFGVEDHGPGIPREAQARIFEPFERFDPESGYGTGLGLPVSRRLAEVLGGHLGVESDEGRGATFVLALPASSTMKRS